MYHSNVDYSMPTEVSENLPQFVDCIYRACSPDNSSENSFFNKLINDDKKKILYLIEIIKVSLVDKKEPFHLQPKLIDLSLSYLIRILLEDLQEYYDLLEQGEISPILVPNGILFILPYVAQYCLKFNKVTYFRFLVAFIKNLHFEDHELFINGYISELLHKENQVIDDHIISLILAESPFYYDVSPENKILIQGMLMNYFTYLNDSDMNDFKQQCLYLTALHESSIFLINLIKDGVFPLQIFCQNFLIFVKKYSEKTTVPEVNLSNDIKFLTAFFDFVDNIFPESVDEAPPDLLNLYSAIYLRSRFLISHTSSECSLAIIRFLYRKVNYFRIDIKNPNEVKYFGYFIMTSSCLVGDDFIAMLGSPEVSVIDNFPSAGDFFDCSKRQMVSNIINIFFSDPNLNGLILYLLRLIESTPKFFEFHLFILTEIAKAIIYSNVDDQIKASASNELIKVIGKVKPLVDQNIGSLQISVNPYTEQNLARDAFLISCMNFLSVTLKVFPEMQEEIANFFIVQVMSLTEIREDYKRILFQYFCVIANILCTKRILRSNISNIAEFIKENFDMCQTNDAFDFILHFSAENNDLPEIFNSLNYCMNKCIEFANFVKFPFSESADLPMYVVDDNIWYSKEFDYKLEMFKKNISQLVFILNLLKTVEFNDEIVNKFANIIRFMTICHDDWFFYDEEIDLLSALLVRPDFVIWIKMFKDISLSNEKVTMVSDWMKPFIFVISERPNDISQEIVDLIIQTCIKYIGYHICDNGHIFMNTEDTVLLFNLLARTFELVALGKVSIQNDDAIRFFNLTNDFPNESDNPEEFNLENFKSAGVMLKLAAFLAGLVNQEELINTVQMIISDNLVANKEIRFLVVLVLDKFFPGNQSLAQFRQNCLSPEIESNARFDLFDGFISSILHPIMKAITIEGFQ